MIRGQQDFKKYELLNPIKIKIEKRQPRYKCIKKYKNATYRVVPVSLLSSSAIKDDTDQIFIVSNGLHNMLDALLNRKIYKILRVINLN